MHDPLTPMSSHTSRKKTTSPRWRMKSASSCQRPKLEISSSVRADACDHLEHRPHRFDSLCIAGLHEHERASPQGVTAGVN